MYSYKQLCAKQSSSSAGGCHLECWPAAGEWRSVQACLSSGSAQPTARMPQPLARQSTSTCTKLDLISAPRLTPLTQGYRL